jgi:hypothetical protein
MAPQPACRRVRLTTARFHDFGCSRIRRLFRKDALHGKLLVRLALSAVAWVGLAVPAASQLPADPQPPVPVRAPPKPVPAALSKDCTDRIAKDQPKTKIVGPFSFAFHISPLKQYLVDKAGGDVNIYAPAQAPGFMDRMVKIFIGCNYDLKGGVPVFREVLDASKFPIRYRKVPGDG